MSKREDARRRGAIQWLFVITTFVIGVGLLIGFVGSAVDDYMLSRHGVRAVATVADVRGRLYLLDFNNRDGARVAEWAGDVQSSTRVGDQITVVYDPHAPGNVQDVREFSLGLWAVLLFIPLGLVFLWLTRLQFRMRPEQFRMYLRRHHGIQR